MTLLATEKRDESLFFYFDLPHNLEASKSVK